MNNKKDKRFTKFSVWLASFLAFFGIISWLTIALSLTEEQPIKAAVEKKSSAQAGSTQASGMKVKSFQANGVYKPVIVLLYDSLMSKPLQQAIDEGKAPAFDFLIKRGSFYPDVVSSYPTMSVAIDSTILTGSYPDHHHVPGLIWFDEQEQKIVSYGSGPHETIVNGIANVLQHSTIHLNQQHLSKQVETIYEKLAQQNIQAASINGLIYRGNTAHELHVPQLLAHLNTLPRQLTVTGPDLLSLGVLSQYNKDNDHYNYAWNKFGFNNQFAVNELAFLIKQHKLPPFTLAYLPDADTALHKHGPDDVQAIEQADQSLQQLLNLFGSWEAASQQAIWVVLGDSGQTLVDNDKKQALIAMDELLKSYRLWSPKQQDGQLALALNERMGYIHIRDSSIDYAEVVKLLQQDKRLSLIAWHEQGKNYVVNPDLPQQFSYSPQGSYVDSYNQSWAIEGDPKIIDLTIDEHLHITYGQFPDALARLNGALHVQEGNIIIVDVKPSYELQDETSYNHVGGGSHGSLHQEDSLVPLIVTGSDIPFEDKRLVALQQWLLSLLLQQREQ